MFSYFCTKTFCVYFMESQGHSDEYPQYVLMEKYNKYKYFLVKKSPSLGAKACASVRGSGFRLFAIQASSSKKGPYQLCQYRSRSAVPLAKPIQSHFRPTDSAVPKLPPINPCSSDQNVLLLQVHLCHSCLDVC